MKDEKEIIDFFLSKNILLNKEVINKFIEKEIDIDIFYNILKDKIKSDSFLVLDKDIEELLTKIDNLDINWKEFEKSLVMAEKGDKKLYNKFINYLEKEKKEKPAEKEEENKVKIVFSYKDKPKKRVVQDFVSYFNKRFDFMENLLQKRQELQNLMSINRIKAKREKDNISLIGIVSDKIFTKNNNLILTVEDKTGSMKVLVNKTKPDMFKLAKDIVLDEVIGVVGVNGENIVFANNVVWPDVPSGKEIKKAKDDVCAVFLSDFHVGSDNFLGENLDKFIKWLNYEVGSDKQKELAKKIKYIFIVGDLVDGCGIYPGQEDELVIKDIYEQYEECARILKKIPHHIKLIICPGNHDALRIAEPQPELYKDFSKALWELENVIMVSNPAIVNIQSSNDFSGFDILLYHGYSFDYYVPNVDSIRFGG
ncbi:MAG: metallophosphoesterase, partial [Nanoarchaeota archaeon]|nr:metallophosphoesterase [Nanoarchaeota archaeon]